MGPSAGQGRPALRCWISGPSVLRGARKTRAGLGRRGLFGGSSSAPLPPRRRVCRWPTAHVNPRKQDRAKGLRAEAKGSCTAMCPLHWGGLEGHSQVVLLRLLPQITIDWVANEQQTLTSHSCGAGGLRSGCRPGQVPVRTLFVVCRQPPSPCGFTWQKGGELALWSLPITLMASSNPHHLPKALPPDTITLGLGFNI